MLYQGSASFPCCLLFRAQTNQTLRMFHQLWVGLAHSHMYPSCSSGLWYPWSRLPNSDISWFWRHTSVSEGALRKLPWFQRCEPTAFDYDAISYAHTVSTLQVLCCMWSSPLACAQLYKMIDMSTCFIWFVLRFLSGASLTMVNHWLDCILCLSLIHFFKVIGGSHILVNLLHFCDQEMKSAVYI